MIPSEYLGPFIGSNVVALLLILVAVLRPKAARIIFSLIFLAAGLFNLYTAWTTPEAYLMYGEMTFLPMYRAFINGFFSQNLTLLVSLIAAGQLTISLLLALGGRSALALTLGTLGAIIFLTAIIPLGVGSAFPFSLLAIAALIIMLVKLNHRAGHAVPSTAS